MVRRGHERRPPRQDRSGIMSAKSKTFMVGVAVGLALHYAYMKAQEG